MNPVGDVQGGLSPDDYDFLKEIAPIKGGLRLDDPATPDQLRASEYTITDDQMRNSFYRYVQLKLWDVINKFPSPLSFT